MFSSKTPKRPILNALSVLLLAFLLLILWVMRFGDDAYGLVMLTDSVPPIVFAILPIVLLTVSSVMRRRGAIVLNILSLLLAAGPIMGFHWRFMTPATPGRSVRVMTRNVEKWSHGPDAVANGVRAAHPDIVCFQEAGDYFYVQGAQGKGLIAALPDYHFVRAGEVIVASRWPVVKLAETLLPPGPDTRPALSVSVQIDGRPCTVTCVHLIPSEVDRHLIGAQSPLSDYAPRYAAQRASQGAALRRKLNTFSGPQILCGDFNAPPPAPMCRNLTHAYPDAFETAGRGYGYTLTATTPLERIDHILTSRDITVQDCWVPAVIASDHRAVVVDVILPKKR